jgi:SAM-dependent methyltransferase
MMSIPVDVATFNLPEATIPYARTISTEISKSDGMYQGNVSHYFSCGASALNCILSSLRLAGTHQRWRTILDFGCGAGRVLRWIRAAFPESILYGSDVREQDLEFVRQTFNAITWTSGTRVVALESPAIYDLIWVGSVFTHLSEADSTSLFDKLLGWLAPDGVLIFSVHGRGAIRRDNEDPSKYGLGGNRHLALEALNERGYGYADYPGQKGYGISFSRLRWWINLIEGRSNVKLIFLSEEAWDNHHDVIGIRRVG